MLLFIIIIIIIIGGSGGARGSSAICDIDRFRFIVSLSEVI